MHVKYWSLLEGQTSDPPSAWSETGQVKKPSGLVEALWTSEPCPRHHPLLYFTQPSCSTMVVVIQKFFLPSRTSSSSLDNIFSSLNVMIFTMGSGERAQHWECSLLLQRTGVSSQHTCLVVHSACNASSEGSSGLHSNPHIHSHK